jgi:hypothetical protein
MIKIKILARKFLYNSMRKGKDTEPDPFYEKMEGYGKDTEPDPEPNPYVW